LSSLHAIIPVPDPSQLLTPVHAPTGLLSSWNCEMGTQSPGTPPLHWKHVVSHALSQQTPSTQLLLKHSEPAPHAVPFDFLHAPMPSHDSPIPEHIGASCVPFGTFTQAPTLPLTLHAMHMEPHVIEQQTPSSQIPLRQSDALAGHVSPVLTLHAPVASQTSVPPHPGSESPTPTDEQVPSLPGRLHALHTSVHVVSQQKLSTQLPVMQSPATLQEPLAFLQLPEPSHWFVPVHVIDAFGSVWPAGMLTHWPSLPDTLHALHVAVQELWQQKPSTQVPFRQSLLPAQPCPTSFLHWPLPLQETLEPVHEGESSWPVGTFEHVPTLPDTLHALHVPVQPELQHTESTQFVLRHSLFAPQFLLFDFLHWPLPLQTSPPFWLHADPDAVFV